MSEQAAPMHGYACVPYTHDHDSISLKDEWQRSRNVESMHFVTATFSPDSKPYFESLANHYLLARFRNNARVLRTVEMRKREKASFVFSIDENLFEREASGAVNLVSVYYLEYGETDEDVGEVAAVIARKDKVGKAGVGHMDLRSNAQRFDFPYGDRIVVLEVSSDKNHQSINKYCEKTRRDVCRIGITMTNMVSLSLLEKLK